MDKQRLKHLTGAQVERNIYSSYSYKAACGSGKPGGLNFKERGKRMHEVIFKHISISNFCGIKDLDTDLWEKTVVKGKNRAGKSTIRNAIMWVLTGNLVSGKDAGTSIRPQSEDGTPVDFVDISVSLTVSIDGSEYILTKTQKQKWQKKRGSEEKTKEGNENLFEISGVPKRTKDFEKFIEENICPISELSYCLNANTFLNLDTKKRREKVLGLAKSFTDDDVIALNPDFEVLRADLKIGTLEELTKRSSATISKLKEEQRNLPVRIDEVSKQKVDLDFSALELEKNVLEEQLAEYDRMVEESEKLKEQALKARFDLSGIENSLNSEYKDKRHDLEMKLSEMKANLRTVFDDITRLESEQEKAETLVENNEKAIRDASAQMDLAKGRVFDDTELICPNCKQPYPKEHEATLRKDFEERNAAELSRLSDYIESLIGGRDNALEKVNAIKKKISDTSSVKSQYEKDISGIENEIANLIMVDPTKDASYVAKMDEITALETKARECLPTTDKHEIKAKYADVDRQLAQADMNNQIDDRIAELRQQLSDVANKMLKEEHTLYLLQEFAKAKITLVEESVNKYFDLIRWKFYQTLENGGYQSVCRALVGGVDYDVSLNKSDRILCQLDICKGFMKSAGVTLPLLADDTESVDDGRIPDYDGQVILFRRDDTSLTVESW